MKVIVSVRVRVRVRPYNSNPPPTPNPHGNPHPTLTLTLTITITITITRTRTRTRILYPHPRPNRGSDLRRGLRRRPLRYTPAVNAAKIRCRQTMPCLTLHQRRVSIFVGLGERAVEDVVELCAQSPERVFASRPPGSLNQPSYQLRGEGGLLRRQNVAVGGDCNGAGGGAGWGGGRCLV